jgi:hypothetical protein
MGAPAPSRGSTRRSHLLQSTVPPTYARTAGWATIARRHSSKRDGYLRATLWLILSATDPGGTSCLRLAARPLLCLCDDNAVDPQGDACMMADSRQPLGAKSRGPRTASEAAKQRLAEHRRRTTTVASRQELAQATRGRTARVANAIDRRDVRRNWALIDSPSKSADALPTYARPVPHT